MWKRAHPRSVKWSTAVDDVLRQEPLIGNPLSIRNLIDALPGEGAICDPDVIAGIVATAAQASVLSTGRRRHAKVGFRLQDIGIASYGPVFMRIEQQLAEIQRAHPNFRLNLSGNAVWRWKNLYQIVVDLAFSLGTASVIIFGVLAVVYRSLAVGIDFDRTEHFSVGGDRVSALVDWPEPGDRQRLCVHGLPGDRRGRHDSLLDPLPGGRGNDREPP